MSQPDIRKGMPPRRLERGAFEQRFKSAFVDPVFAPLQRELQAVTDAAWDAYDDSRKAPITRKAGAGFADPDYEIAIDWLAARAAIEDAQRRHDDPAGPSRILVVNGSSRTEHTCPGEMSKSWRLVEIARETFKARPGFEVDVLDLSRTTSEFGKTIHPCKSCVSTAMPLCHWPCSCYPNYALGQTHDWMNEIYPLWVAAHGILVVTPVNWYQVPGPLKAMIDRLVCADGGNPDPSSTPWQGCGRGQGPGAGRMALSAPSRRPPIRRGRARRHCRRGVVAPRAGGLGERPATDARRLEVRGRRLYRLLRALRHRA
jgi:multimeric flavodoxin WrbA